jgi:hypothetical protein
MGEELFLMPTPRIPRLPFAPVEDRIKKEGMSDVALAEALRVHRDSLRHYRERGLNVYAADRLACKLGYHPTYFWGDDYFADLLNVVNTKVS